MSTQRHTRSVFTLVSVSLSSHADSLHTEPRGFLPSLSACPLGAPSATRLTNDGFPLPVGLRDLIGAAHFAEGNAANDEDHDTWPSAVLSGRLVLVPVTIPSTVVKENTSRVSL